MSNSMIQGYRTSADMLAELEAEDVEYFQHEHEKSSKSSDVKIVTVPERGFAI